MIPRDPMRQLLASLRSRQGEMLGMLARFTRCESPTEDKEQVDRLGRMVAAEWRRRGARVERLRKRRSGDHLRVLWPGRAGRGGQLLVLGHLDTVYPRGTLEMMPFRAARGRAFGPGVLDMKGGLVIALFAADALARAGWRPERRIVFLWTSDEETGSATSRAVIEREARRSAAVLVLEPASGLEGRLKTQRKGVGTAEITITGRAAHAGLDPEEGVNALEEMAIEIARLAQISQPRRGITVIPTVAEAGSRSNVIPAMARLVVDLRAGRAADMRAVERKLRRLRPVLPGAMLQVSGGFSRPPMERRVSAELFRRARQLAQAMGLSLAESSVGGGSDGNYTAALGVPTLDGLGAVGEGAHSTKENVVVRALPERAALVAGLMATL
jgi:glutamate carboxypeptidase